MTLTRRRLMHGAGVAGFGLLAGCAAVTLPTMPPRRPAVVAVLVAETLPASDLDRFRAGLAERGWALGHNLVLAERSAEGRYERLPELAEELLALPPDVVVLVGAPAAAVIGKVPGTVPYVIVTGSDPVPAEARKRLELLIEMAPRASRIGVFWREPAALAEVDDAAQARQVGIYPVEVVSSEALWRGVDAAVAWGANALQLEPAPVVEAALADVATFAAARKLPAISGHRDFARVGGLTSYAVSQPDKFRRAGADVDNVLRSASPATLPIEQPAPFELVINLKTAHALGVTIPQHVLLQATEVIQ